MYTVARFVGNAGSRDLVLELAATMNASRGDAFAGFGKRGDGFACDVCRDGAWAEHEPAIRGFVAEFHEPIRHAVDRGVVAIVDIAIGSEDREASSAFVGLSVPPDLASALAAAGVYLHVSVY